MVQNRTGASPKVSSGAIGVQRGARWHQTTPEDRPSASAGDTWGNANACVSINTSLWRGRFPFRDLTPYVAGRRAYPFALWERKLSMANVRSVTMLSLAREALERCANDSNAAQAYLSERLLSDGNFARPWFGRRSNTKGLRRRRSQSS
jgi:hypothetical protein